MNFKIRNFLLLMIFEIAMISAYVPNHEYNMLEKRKFYPNQIGSYVKYTVLAENIRPLN